MRAKQAILLLVGLGLLVGGIVWLAIAIGGRGLAMNIGSMAGPVIMIAGALVSLAAGIVSAPTEIPSEDPYVPYLPPAPPLQSEEVDIPKRTRKLQDTPLSEPDPFADVPSSTISEDADGEFTSGESISFSDVAPSVTPEPAPSDPPAEPSELSHQDSRSASSTRRAVDELEEIAPPPEPVAAPSDMKALLVQRIRESGWEQLVGDDPAEQRAMIEELFTVMVVEEGITLPADVRQRMLQHVTADVLNEINIRFSAYYPQVVKPEDWQSMVAYIYRDFANGEIRADVAERVGNQPGIIESATPAKLPVQDGALVTATPQIDGFEFDPPSASRRFRDDWRRFEFEFQAVEGTALNTSHIGTLSFSVEGVIVADVPLLVTVKKALIGEQPPKEISAKPYDAIFCSYSHKDTAIVERLELAYKAIGMDYLRDVVNLRAGEDWNDALLALIDRADIFQLFWSEAASTSPHVAREWQHALALVQREKKPRTFIRPVWWQKPLAGPPEAMQHIHFAYRPELGQ